MIGGFPIAGAPIAASGQQIVVYAPVSRIIAGGFSNGRPAQVATLIEAEVMMWDDGDVIMWDDGTAIAWTDGT
jgi:hypothetical protein